MYDYYMRTLVPFGVLAGNSVFFGVLRGMIGRPMDPNVLQWILIEFAATMELCADCAELDVIYDMHGSVGYGLTLFVLCFLWGQTWFKAAATPCDPIENLINREDNMKNIGARIVGQLLAAIVTHRYCNSIWAYRLIPEHKKYHNAHCETPLQVAVYWGFAIEGSITLISRLVQLEVGSFGKMTENFLNSITTVVLVLAALDTTGGYFNPALASALKFNCAGSPHWQFFAVYWLGAIGGNMMAGMVHSVLHRKRSVTHITFRRASTPANRNLPDNPTARQERRGSR